VHEPRRPELGAAAPGRREEKAMSEIEVIEANDAFTHVAVRGRLDVTGVGEVELDLTKHTVARRRPAIVDITAVDILASIGVGMLVKIARSMHSHGLIFGVVATGISKETLERLQVNTVFPVVATYDQALKTLMLE
jgi:anti-anti-sigma factor